MIQLDDIYSLSDFQRRTKEHLKAIKKSGRPRVLTVNGKAELIVQDAKGYQKLLAMAERLEAIEGIRQGLDEVKRGKTRPFRAVVEGLRRKYEVSR